MTPLRMSRAAYLGPGDAYHIADKRLGRAWPAPHDHDYHEVFLVEAGPCRHRVNGHEEALETGTLVFIRPGDAHALAAGPEGPCRIVNIVVTDATVAHLQSRYPAEVAGRFFATAAPRPATYRLGPAGLRRALDMILPLRTGPRSLVRIESAMLALIAGLTELPPGIEAGMPGWLARACEAARRPEVQRRGAAGLVAAAGRAHAHVCRQMKRHTGLTPSAYVNRLRLERAAALLLQGEARLPEIAAEIGLDNLSHFHRLFRARYGMTPRAWRRLHAGVPR